MCDQVDAFPELPRPVDGSSNSGGHVDKVAGKFDSLTVGSDGVDGAASDRYRYKMNNSERGKFIIINNKSFALFTEMGERSGTDLDAANLHADFKRLGFKVEMHHNKTKDEMLKLMIDEGGRDHSRCDCFGVAVLTHGDDGVLYGIDGIISVDHLVQPIKNCKSLAGKPKIFIFQACRGNDFDDGVNVCDAVGEKAPAQRIPLEADFLYAYSTTPGYFAWRNSGKGSWFIQALHRMLEKYVTELDFVKILTRVNYEVAYAFESNSSDASFSGKKQIPSIVSMLTKDLYFTRK